jgi:hypothetical protein
VVTSEYPDIEELYAWARYLYWSDLLFQRYNAVREHQEPEMHGDIPADWPAWWLSFAVTSQWFAAEFVAIEGWRGLKCSDSVIDRLLNKYPQQLAMLRRYRNAVYHFSPTLYEKRFREFLANAFKTLPWLMHVHAELLRYYWQFIEDLPGATAEDRATMRRSALMTVGWIPNDIFPARRRAAQDLLERARLLTAGDDSEAARELRNQAAHAVRIALEASETYGKNLASVYDASE